MQCGSPDHGSAFGYCVSVKQAPRLPKNALANLNIGQSFAEYDQLLVDRNVFVVTPAVRAAGDSQSSQCFFVGRRGTGKTTITRFLEVGGRPTLLIRPEIFSPSQAYYTVDLLKEGNQRPFKSLVAAFRRALQATFLEWWHSQRSGSARLNSILSDELSASQGDFDLSTTVFVDEILASLKDGNEADWLLAIKRPKTVSSEINDAKLLTASQTILLDAIDESWDGSEMAVMYLAALMHAALEINTQVHNLRVLVFIRENIFERVRRADSEFSRLETCVVGLDWTREQLMEMIEKRLNHKLVSKLALGGPTWDAFFEETAAKEMIFGFCQERPRDVLTYVALAIENAKSRNHHIITRLDVLDARRRFSTSRLGDLGDEYQENYPQISLVIGKFYGLGQRWTVRGVRGLLERMLADREITTACAKWIHQYRSAEQFCRLLYDIGFFGFSDVRRGGERVTRFRSLGPSDTTPPPISSGMDLAVHPTYWDALDLQDVLMADFSDGDFPAEGVVADLPGSYDLETYNALLDATITELRDMPTGREAAQSFENLVGDVLELCFFRWLANVEGQVRDVDGATRKDWIASNRAETGFWQLARQRYAADQVIFECKNYEELHASDFQQLAYYMQDFSGRLGFLVYRGEPSPAYIAHQKRVLHNQGLRFSY